MHLVLGILLAVFHLISLVDGLSLPVSISNGPASSALSNITSSSCVILSSSPSRTPKEVDVEVSESTDRLPEIATQNLFRVAIDELNQTIFQGHGGDPIMIFPVMAAGLEMIMIHSPAKTVTNAMALSALQQIEAHITERYLSLFYRIMMEGTEIGFGYIDVA